jgi:excisionase family DNA binding protein
MRTKEMAEMEDRWLSVEEIGKYLGVSSDTVYRWIDKHDMPAHKIGRLWKFKKDEIDEWVRSGGANTSPPDNKISESRRRES